MLTLIGLGLRDGDIARNGIAALQEADVVYAELYTNSIRYDLDALEQAAGTEITVLDREEVEDEDVVVSEAAERDVAFLVSGDPLTATTHQDILFRARANGIATRVVHAPSILTAVTETGLSVYKFGRTTTLPEPYDGTVPDSPFDVVADNRERGLHTLLLLDIGMTVGEALAIAGDRLPEKLVAAVGLGTDDARIRYGSQDDIREMAGVPASLIVPGTLSDNERERLDAFRA